MDTNDKTWYEAYQDCASDGAQLAMIKNAEQLAAVAAVHSEKIYRVASLAHFGAKCLRFYLIKDVIWRQSLFQTCNPTKNIVNQKLSDD
jgi:hypothetical protein